MSDSDDIEKGCHACADSEEIQMVFEGGSSKKRQLKKAIADSESDPGIHIPRHAKSKGFKKRNLEGGSSGESNKRGLLDPRFSKGEILRENTKKTGLKSFKEDKKKGGKKSKNDKVRDGGSKKTSSKGKTI